jgi:hypothetical protein
MTRPATRGELAGSRYTRWLRTIQPRDEEEVNAMRTDYPNTMLSGYADKLREREHAARRAAVEALDEQVEALHYRADVARVAVERAEAKREQLAARLRRAHERWDPDEFAEVAPRFSASITECGQAWGALHAVERQLEALERERAHLLAGAVA